MKYLHVVLITLGLFCGLLALLQTSNSGPAMAQVMEPLNNEFGPLLVESSGTYELKVENYVPVDQWTYIEVDVLDASKNYLFSFSDEMWREQGRDSEGVWVEGKSEFSLDFMFAPGEYYFVLSSQRSPGSKNDISLTLTPEVGSYVLFKSLAILFVVSGFVLSYFKPNKKAFSFKTYFLLGLIILPLLLATAVLSRDGYGYMGYEGYHQRPHYLYSSSVDYHFDRSLREGSLSGSSQRGGGLSGGK